jgi:hypothetical protein
MNFTTKNKNRRDAYRANPNREARTLRRKLGGAFGTQPVEVFNLAVQGTTGVEKAKGEKN